METNGKVALTERSKELFMEHVSDAPNWGGRPLVDISKEDRGNLTQLKVAGLVTTFTTNENVNGRQSTFVWMEFTEKGIDYAITVDPQAGQDLAGEYRRLLAPYHGAIVRAPINDNQPHIAKFVFRENGVSYYLVNGLRCPQNEIAAALGVRGRQDIASHIDHILGDLKPDCPLCEADVLE